ncbi:hypothetical protein FBU59_006976 [Linderina macrospora]|uniref:Uncharacterized protein n=1 Tax=Linderina macrospora TaxID=4868 RepID=A0ACC1IYC3_9FUNG|nr:hypothetical protein FBU59_006976 [Linderina macrospora]
MNRLEDEFKKKLMVYERKRNEIDAMVQRTDELLKAHQAINAHIMGRINDLSSMSMEVDELEDLFKETPVDYSKIDNIVDSLSAIADKHDIHPTVSEAIDNLNIVRGFGYSVYTQLKEMPQQAQSQSKALAGDKGRLAQIFATIEFLQDSASERIKEKCIQEMEQREMRHEEATMGVKEACRKQLGEYCTSSMKYTGGERELYWETAEIPESKIQDLKDKLEAGSARDSAFQLFP